MTKKGNPGKEDTLTLDEHLPYIRRRTLPLLWDRFNWEVVIYDLNDSRDYLSGIVITTKYICLRCQATIHQNISYPSTASTWPIIEVRHQAFRYL